MQPKSTLFGVARRIPTPVAIIIGVFIGALLARTFSSSSTSSSTSWRGGRAPSYKSSSTSRPAVSLPTLEQRYRVLELLTSLSPHYTRECTRNANPLYAQQARERYAPLIGHNPSQSSNWLMDLGLGGLDPIPHPSQEEATYYKHRRDLAGGEHKFAPRQDETGAFTARPEILQPDFGAARCLTIVCDDGKVCVCAAR